MWIKPEGANFVGGITCPHPNDQGRMSWYYRLIRFRATGEYRLLGMGGEIRSVPLGWAIGLELAAEDQLSSVTLAAQLGQHPATARRWISRLVEAGLVKQVATDIPGRLGRPIVIYGLA